MKNSNFIINGILTAAVIVLFILQFTGKKEVVKNQEVIGVNTDTTGSHLSIAYVRTDSLMLEYNFFNDLNDAMIKKIEDKNLVMNQRADKLAKEINYFQQKAQANAFISDARQAQEQEQLLRQQQNLEKDAAQIQRELSLEQANMIQQVQDTIIAAMKVFNTPKKFEMILCNAGTDNILYADDVYNITREIIDFLNARYESIKK